MIAGNHDWKGNVTAQIAYTNISPNNRWQFPSYYYSKQFAIPDTSYTLEIIFLDTIILCGDSADSLAYCKKHNLIPNSNQCSTTPMGPSDPLAAAYQWIWLNQTLKSSTADFIIVAGHYPVWSTGEHGPTAVLVERLKPLLLEFGVQLYIDGHDHSMQYIEEYNYGSVGYVVTGAAKACNVSAVHLNDVPPGSLLYRDCDDGGFVRVQVDENGMKVYYYVSNSQDVSYTTKVFPPRSSKFTNKTDLCCTGFGLGGWIHCGSSIHRCD